MKNFEQVSIHDITDPIPPEPPFPWLSTVSMIVAFIILGTASYLLLKHRKKITRRFLTREKSNATQALQKQLKKHNKKAAESKAPDLDLWWSYMLEAWKQKAIITRTDTTLEELKEYFKEHKDLNMGESSFYIELIELMDAYKYQGGLNEQDLNRAVACYREMIKRM